MKLVFAIMATLVSLSASATSLRTSSDYCRPVKVGPGFGRPPGSKPVVGHHCISFRMGSLTDNAPTFFGNPPEDLEYKMDGHSVLVLRKGRFEKAFEFLNPSRIISVSGQTFDLVK